MQLRISICLVSYPISLWIRKELRDPLDSRPYQPLLIMIENLPTSLSLICASSNSACSRRLKISSKRPKSMKMSVRIQLWRTWVSRLRTQSGTKKVWHASQESKIRLQSLNALMSSWSMIESIHSQLKSTTSYVIICLKSRKRSKTSNQREDSTHLWASVDMEIARRCGRACDSLRRTMM